MALCALWTFLVGSLPQSRKIRTMNSPQTDTFLSITELNTLASQVLSDQFGLVWLRAEIGSVTKATSGHWYLTLKDTQSSVKAVMFRSRAILCTFEPKVGDAVQVQARVGLYEPRGDFQLNVQVLRPDGRGSLHEQFLQLKAKLQAEVFLMCSSSVRSTRSHVPLV
jgi:exodeoxyribonuclease VII large subunit